jgi:hypothetical protein
LGLFGTFDRVVDDPVVEPKPGNGPSNAYGPEVSGPAYQFKMFIGPFVSALTSKSWTGQAHVGKKLTITWTFNNPLDIPAIRFGKSSSMGGHDDSGVRVLAQKQGRKPSADEFSFPMPGRKTHDQPTTRRSRPSV